VIQIDDLSVRFGAVTAIDGLSVTFSEPIIGVIGPNGAGKTTLLDAIAGAVPSSGSIQLGGEEISSSPAYQRARAGIRRSFQSSRLVDELSVVDNVRLGLDAIDPASSRGGQAMEALRSLELEHLAQRRAGELVNLERRLVGLARCVVARPRVLLLDEPGAGLVSHEKQRLAESVLEAATTFAGFTILIEHDMEFVAATCPTVVALNFGRLLKKGPTADVLADARVRSAYFGEEL